MAASVPVMRRLILCRHLLTLDFEFVHAGGRTALACILVRLGNGVGSDLAYSRSLKRHGIASERQRVSPRSDSHLARLDSLDGSHSGTGLL